jgi:hypothetical protein
MAYEEQSNPDQYEDLDRLLARYPAKDLVSQIPGQTAAGAKTEEPKSLRQRAVSALTQANPLMMRKSMEDMARTVVGGAALPVVAPISAGIQALNAAPGNMYRRSQGQPEVDTPSTEELMRKYGEFIAPKTQMGRDFEAGLGKAMDTAKIPHAWSLSPPAPRRPMLTPTDVRVGAGQMKQLAKELRETPADFQAAQSGLKRQNLYGEDTIGVKAQAAADALGDTLENRRMAGKSVIPGVPQALTPDNKMYAVRPKGSRIVQPKVPESARGYRPDVSSLEGIVENVYGDTPAAKMPPEMVSAEYAKRFLTPDSELAGAFKNYMTLRVQEMFPDAPTPRAAQNAYDTLYSNKTERTKQQMVELEEFLNLPENAAYRENAPTPTEFMQRMGEAERVIKGPFTTYLSKNVGAEGDPTVKLARQGITFESPEAIEELSYLVTPADLAAKRLEAGFPIMGTYAEESFQKAAEFDALTKEIDALEAVRRPLFDQAQAEGTDPASIPEYAETTNPLRQKLRQREQLQGEIENIALARAVEDISDSAIEPKTKQEMLERIPYEQRQFYPGVTKAGEGEKLYMGRESIIRDLGFNKLGKALVEDILTGKAGDTSKLTIENYMREKGLSRIEAEKAAKLQEQKYRETLQNTLLERIRSDQNVKTFGNAAIITLDQNTPKDVAMRDMSADTAVLDHCVGQCGTAPQGRKNILTGKQQYYEPVFDPITGERNARGSENTRYVKDLEDGYELVSVRDVKTGLPAATLEMVPSREGQFRIGYASGAKNGSIDPAYTNAIRDYLNSRSAVISSPGSNLADNAGIFDSTSPAEFKRAAREAGLTEKQVKATDWYDLPRFVTVDDVKAAAKGTTGTEVAVVEPQRQAGAVGEPMPSMNVDDLIAGYSARMTQEQRDWLSDFVQRWDENEDNYQETGVTIQPQLVAEYDQWMNENRLQPARQQGQARAVGEPIPEVWADELLAGYSDRLTPEQIEWLSDFQGRFERNEGGAREDVFIDQYNEWVENNTLAPDPLANLFDDLEPDPTAVANQGAGLPLAGRDVYELAGQYDVPPAIIRNIVAEVTGAPVERAFELQNEAFTGAGRFATLQEASRTDAVRLIGDLLNERRDAIRNERQQAQQGNWQDVPGFEPIQAPQPAAQLAQRNPIPREIQTMSAPDLAVLANPNQLRQSMELANTYFNDNIIDGPNISIGSLTGMLRDYDIGPHAGVSPAVRELAARELERLHTEAEGSAEQLADSLNEAIYMDLDPQEAMAQIDRDISMLERNGELAWEDLVGPMAEDIPWNRNVQHHLLGYLRELANRYGDMREEGYAKGGMVKKKRRAKKDGMPLILTRKSPELTELAYQYGGIVG